VRSQAAARYEVSPAEIVVAARAPNAADPRKPLDEDAIAECLAQAADVPYLKIDPLKVDGALVTRTLSRPFARRHAVVPVAERGEALLLALTDPFDAALRESLEALIRRPLEYVVAAAAGPFPSEFYGSALIGPRKRSLNFLAARRAHRARHGRAGAAHRRDRGGGRSARTASRSCAGASPKPGCTRRTTPGTWSCVATAGSPTPASASASSAWCSS
jgi:hypothetical protein